MHWQWPSKHRQGSERVHVSGGGGVCGVRRRVADGRQVIEVADKELGCETAWNSQVSASAHANHAAAIAALW